MKPARGDGADPCSGTTLVEVMVGCVILAVLALAFAASLQYARSMSVLQRDRRTALELANSRLEDFRGAAYSDVQPLVQNYNLYYLRRQGAGWVVSAGGTNETVLLNGKARLLVTTVQYVDVDGGSASFDALRCHVRMQYNAAGDAVSLETMRAQ